MSKANEAAVNGLGTLGTIFAVVLSWTKWHSFWWAFLHAIFGWFYVIYYFIKGY